MYLNKDNFSSYSEYFDMVDESVFNFDNAVMKNINDEHILDLCSDIIERDKLILTFDRKEEKIYSNKPKVLSNTLYGTPDLYFILMKLNQISHPDDLDCSREIFIMNPQNVPELLAVYDHLKNNI